MKWIWLVLFIVVLAVGSSLYLRKKPTPTTDEVTEESTQEKASEPTTGSEPAPDIEVGGGATGGIFPPGPPSNSEPFKSDLKPQDPKTATGNPGGPDVALPDDFPPPPPHRYEEEAVPYEPPPDNPPYLEPNPEGGGDFEIPSPVPEEVEGAVNAEEYDEDV